MISFQEFERLSQEEQVKVLTQLRNTNGVKKILEAWGIPRESLYAVMRELGVPIRQRKQDQNTAKNKRTKTAKSASTEKLAPEPVNMQLESSKRDVCEMSFEGSTSIIKEVLAHLFNAPLYDSKNVKMTVKIDV